MTSTTTADQPKDVEVPRPIPRTSRSVPLLNSAASSTAACAKPCGSEVVKHEPTVDMTSMNMEICRYRKKFGGRSNHSLKVDSTMNPVDSIQQKNGDDVCNIGENYDLATLNARLKDAIDKNNQWQAYDSQREEYVKGLHQKYDALYSRYQKLNADFVHLTSNPSCLAEEQRRHFDGILVQAKQEIAATKDSITKLKNENESLKFENSTKLQKLKEDADQWRTLFEQQKEINKTMRQDMKLLPHTDLAVSDTDKENWDRITSLQREMEMHRYEFSSEQSRRERLEKRLEKIQKKLKYPDSGQEKPATSVQSCHVQRKKLRSTSYTKQGNTSSSGHDQTSFSMARNLTKERRSLPIGNTSASGKIKQGIHPNDTISPNARLNKTYSEFGIYNESNLTCPNCGKFYAVDDHELLLSHIDTCI